MTERQRNLGMYLPVYAIFLLIYLLACFIEPTFFTWANNVNLFTRITPLIIVGIAQTLVILTGGIDLSIGGIIGLSNVVAASLPWVGTAGNAVLWALVPPLIGLVLGLINGFIITRGGFPPLIVTLATGAIWKGISLFILPVPGGEVSASVARAVSGFLFGVVPVPLLIFLAFVFVFHLLLRRTAFGRSIYAIGGNEVVAYECGINGRRVKTWVYALSGMLAGIGGVFLSAWMYSADPLVGEAYILNSIAVSVIAGTSLAGGRGGVVGIVAGAYIYHLINNILNLLAISTFYQYVAKGLVLIVALAITSSSGGLNLKELLRRHLVPEQLRPKGGLR
jgi:ribose transport system permease protein